MIIGNAADKFNKIIEFSIEHGLCIQFKTKRSKIDINKNNMNPIILHLLKKTNQKTMNFI